MKNKTKQGPERLHSFLIEATIFLERKFSEKSKVLLDKIFRVKIQVLSLSQHSSEEEVSRFV